MVINGFKRNICVPAIAACLFIAVEATAEQLEITGITEAIHDITIGVVDSGVGVIDKIYPEEGDFVKKNEILFTLEHSLEQLEVERRKVIMDDRSELDAAVDRARIIEAIYLVNKELYDKTKSVSQEELYKLELELVQSRASLQGLEKAEQREKIEFAIANKLLQKKIIKAPIAGIVTERFIDPGESYEAPEPVIRMVSTKVCLFVCNIEEQWGGSLKKGDTVSLSIQSGKQQMAKQGKVVFVSPVVDSGSGLLEVKVEFSNKDGLIRPGVSGTMILEQ